MPTIDRRQMVAGMALAAGAAALPPSALAASREEISWLPAWKLREMMVARHISAVEVTEHFLARIAALEPKLHAFREIQADGARRQAQAADQALARGAAPGPLHGIPIAIKEEIAVKGFVYAEKEGRVSVYDDLMVEKLRQAGAIVVGTTVMPGMGHWPDQKAAYGTEAPTADQHPRNPWRLDRVPGSSSAGSAAAAAAAMVPIAIGGDGGGSTRLPGALCGVVGVHTAFGRIPTVDYDNGHFQLTNTHGPLCRDIRDAATVMQAVSGPDGRDFISIQDKIDFLADLDHGVSGMKFAWTDDYGFGAMELWRQAGVVEAIRAA
ncbi:MAG: putative amidase protein, partial [Rhizorhabdus sp.]|nr:putative amidase protein [Rhizorhabdus sp.]